MYGHPYDCPPWCPHCRAAYLGAALDDELGTSTQPYALARSVARKHKQAQRASLRKHQRMIRKAAGTKFKRQAGRTRTLQSSKFGKRAGVQPRFQPGRRTSGSTVGPMIQGGRRGPGGGRRGPGGRRFGRKGQRLMKMRFSRIRRRLARRLGLKVQ
ncbi:MAG: hypothetical protein ACYSYU_10650, partial [Planctomycetota bacterium]